MPKKKPIEMVTPPNLLKAKVGKLPALDKAAIARAEAALNELSVNFDAWLKDEVTRLEEAYATVSKASLTGPSGETFFRCVHDIKGLGTTYNFPIVTRIADGLCKLLETEDRRAHAPMALVAAHVQTIRAAVRDDVRTENHPVGKVLVSELETRVRDHLNKQAAA